MQVKIIKRVVLIFIISILIIVSIGYKYGLFNTLLNEDMKKEITNELNNTSSKIDTVSSASTSTGYGDEQESKNEIIVPNSTLENQSFVSIVQSPKQSAKEITSQEIREMVREAVNLAGGFKGLIKDNQVVVLKPNLVQKHVDSTGELFDKEINGITTDWRITKAVAELVREYNPHGKVYVMEGSAGDKTKDVMNYLNYTPEYIPEVDEFIAIEEDSGGWQEFNSSGLVKYSLPNGLLHKEYYLNKKYFEADVLISIPCLKTNSGTVVTGGIKNVSIGATPANIYGVSPKSPGRTKMVSHKIVDGDLDKWIYDYYMCKPVNFTVIDGLEGFQNGPVPVPTGKKTAQSDKMNMRLIMAGKDSVAVDAVEALVTGWDPLSIRYLGYLNESSMGNLDTSKITVLGKHVDEVRKDFSIRFANLAGLKISDKTSPRLAIKEQVVNKNKLRLSLEVDRKTIKAEAYIDGQLYTTVPAKELEDIAVDITDLPNGSHSVNVCVFDRFLNHSEQKITITK